MPTLIITTREGSEHTIETASGMSVMEAIRNAGIDEMQALCGGGCSCATCHIYVDANFLGSLPSVGVDEDSLLDSSDHRVTESRLACQIQITDELNGFRARIAPEE